MLALSIRHIQQIALIDIRRPTILSRGLRILIAAAAHFKE
jgi:hypothetical protein